MIDTTMRKLRVLVTEVCNRQCFYCHNEGQPFGTTYISLSKVREVVSQLSDVGTRTIVVSGGEPTLHPNIVQILRAIKSEAPGSIELVTNGTFPLVLKQILEERLIDRCKLHVDGYDQRTHHRVGKDDIQPLLCSVELLQNSRVSVMTETPVWKIDQIKPILEVNKSTGFSSKFLQIRDLNGKAKYPHIDEIEQVLMAKRFTLIRTEDYESHWIAGGQFVIASSKCVQPNEDDLFLQASGQITNNVGNVLVSLN